MTVRMTLKIWLDGQWRDLMTFAPALYPQVRDGAREFANMTSCNLIIIEAQGEQAGCVIARYWGAGLPAPLGEAFSALNFQGAEYTDEGATA